MKIKRLKQAHKTLNFYKHAFDITPPYKVLIDGTFCKSALTFKINIREQLPKYLGSEVKFFTSKCILDECESMGSILYGPLKVLQQFTVAECRHRNPVSPYRCMRWLIRNLNKNKYFLATQDSELSEKARKLAGVPILYIAFNTITLEAPSTSSTQHAQQVSEEVCQTSDEIRTVKHLKAEVLGEEAEPKTKKRRKGPKNPNPLSCLKKKMKREVTETLVEKKCRSRHRSRKKGGNVAGSLEQFLHE